MQNGFRTPLCQITSRCAAVPKNLHKQCVISGFSTNPTGSRKSANKIVPSFCLKINWIFTENPRESRYFEFHIDFSWISYSKTAKPRLFRLSKLRKFGANFEYRLSFVCLQIQHNPPRIQDCPPWIILVLQLD